MSLFCSTTAPIYGPCVLGLQLIGVYAIILFHIWPSEFCNGFMGVDILFVVFGFLMSIKMVELSNEADNNDTITLVPPASTSSANNSLSYYANFLARFVYEIRRFYVIEFTQIIPLNLTLILGSLVGGFVFFLDDEIEQLRKDTLWALCFGTNHQLTDVDWTFDLIGIRQPRPLLHLWAICVKVQFVLALSPPLLLLVRLKSGTKSASFKCRLVQLSTLFLLLILPSFLFWLSSTSKSVMMGWACSRAWQFLLGTMSALIANQNSHAKTTATEQSKKCLLFSIIVEHLLFYSAAVCLGVVFFLPSVFWPPFFQYKTILTISVSALTAFLLYFFINRLKQKIPLSALSQWLFVNFGQFPLFCFLFHQPLAVFLRSFLTVSQLNIFEGFLAILLITLSSLLVQQIFHKLFANIQQQKCFSSLCVYLIIFGYAFCALFAIAPGTIRLNQKRKNETIPIFDEAQHKVQFWPLDVDSVRKFLQQLQTEAYRNELSPLLNSFAKVKINEMLKNSFTFDTDIPGTSIDLFVRENEMAEDNRHVKRIYEWMLKGNGTRRVLLFGNSHAQVAWREVETSLEGNFNWLHVVSVPGCMPLFENDWRTIYGVRCSQTVKGLLKVAEKTLPDFLFLIFKWYDDLQPQGEPTNLELDPNLNEMQSFMDKLQRFVSGRIFISAPNLQFDTEISHQLAKRIWQNNSLEGLNKNYSKHLEENNSSYQRLGRLRCAKCSVFDLAKEFCWDGICHAFEPGSQLAYFSDRNHLSFLGRLKARETFAKIARSIEEGGERK